MSKVTVPTVGRVVYYTPGEHDNGNNNGAIGGDVQPMAAMVSYVSDEGRVNLSIIDHNGVVFNKTSVVFVDEDQEALPGQCGWMPYQKEAAEKHNADNE